MPAYLKPGWKKGLLFGLMAALVLGFDQLSKLLIRTYLAVGESIPAEGFFRLTHVTNTGASFGLLTGNNGALTVTALIGVAALFIYYRYLREDHYLLRIALGLMLGGATGNLIDRFHQGYVTDFLDIGAWPVFNLADSSIVVGIVIVAGFFLLSLRKHEKA